MSGEVRRVNPQLGKGEVRVSVVIPTVYDRVSHRKAVEVRDALLEDGLEGVMDLEGVEGTTVFVHETETRSRTLKGNTAVYRPSRRQGKTG